MKIYITAKPKSKKEYIKKIDDIHYTVAVKELPLLGKANQAIISALAKYFSIPPYKIHILYGEKSKQKVVEIPG